MAESIRGYRKPLVIFLAIGLATMGGIWAALSMGTKYIERTRSGRIILKRSWETEPIAGGSKRDWRRFREAEWRDYARQHGLGDIEIRYVKFVGDTRRKHISSIIAGEGADIVLITMTEASFFADNGMIEPLDRYLETWPDY